VLRARAWLWSRADERLQDQPVNAVDLLGSIAAERYDLPALAALPRPETLAVSITYVVRLKIWSWLEIRYSPA
jgi:hypothetical protein